MDLHGNRNRRRKIVKNDEENTITYRYNNNNKSRFDSRRGGLGGEEGRRTQKGYNWFLFFGFVAALRMLWSSIAFSKNLEGGGNPYYKMDFPHREMMSKGRPSRRKRPPRHISDITFSSLEEKEEDTLEASGEFLRTELR